MNEEKKLTDDEIVKALEFKISVGCKSMSYLEGFERKEIKVQDILDLILRLQSENESLKKDYIELDLEARELRTELDKELTEHEEFTKKSKAEIERLKGFLSIFETVIAEQQEQVEKRVEEVYPDFMKEYKLAKNDLKESLDRESELQKQVDELTEVYKRMMNSGIYQQAVKDTAKEILQETENLLHECAMEYANAGHKDYFGVCEVISHKVVRKLAKEKGLEV